MAKYNVTYRVVLSGTLTVEADSQAEAAEKADEAMRDGGWDRGHIAEEDVEVTGVNLA